MPVKTFKFHPDIFKNEVTWRPYILIKLGNKNKWSPNFIRALVDSGADSNVFPSQFAKEIGLDYKKGKAEQVTGIGDKHSLVYVNIVKIRLETKEFETVIKFGEEIRIPLLGRDGFFNYFKKVSFSVKEREIEIKFK